MKRILVATSSLSFLSLVLPPIAYAEDGKNIVTCPSGPFNNLCHLTGNSIGSVVGQLITFAFIGATIVALGFLIYGGVKWTVSGGDKTAIEEARNHVVSAVVGLVIVFLAFFIINLVVFFFTGTSLIDIKIPTLTPAQ